MSETTTGRTADDTALDVTENVSMTPAMRNVLVNLEQMMLAGSSDTECRRWAIDKMGIPELTFRRMRALILRSWERDTASPGVKATIRDECHAKYNEIFKRAMQSENYTVAMKAVDSIARISGIDTPQAPVVLGGGGGSQITNVARETVMNLASKMQKLASARASGLIATGDRDVRGRLIVDAASSESPPVLVKPVAPQVIAAEPDLSHPGEGAVATVAQKAPVPAAPKSNRRQHDIFASAPSDEDEK